MKNKLFVLLSGFLAINATAQNYTFDWATQNGNSMGTSVFSITTDASNNVYTTGQFQGTVDFDPGPGTMNLTSNGGGDMFVHKLDASGNLVWAKSFGGSANDFSWAVAIDVSGNVLITGSFQDTVDFDPGAGTENHIAYAFLDVFVLKLDSDGNFIWAKTFGFDQSEVGYSIDTDSNGNVFVVGEFAGTVDFDPGAGSYPISSNTIIKDLFILQLDANGNFVWAKSAGGASNDEARAIVIDSNNDFYVLGNFQGTIDLDPGPGTLTKTSGGDYDAFVQKFDSNGDLIWGQAFGGSNIDQALSLDIDASGNVYTTGYFLGSIDLDPGAGTQNYTATGGGGNIFIQKLDANGDFVWSGVIASASGGEQSRAITVSAAGEMFVTGYAGSTIDFDPGAGVFNLVSNGAYDIFLLKLDALGNFDWAENFGSSSYDYSRSVTLDQEGNILLTGEFQDTVDFDPGAGTFNLTASTSDYFVLKLKTDHPTNAGNEELNFEQEIILYPNPTAGPFTIDAGKIYSEINLEITTIDGQSVLKRKVENNRFIELELPAESGIYFVNLHADMQNSFVKVIKK